MCDQCRTAKQRAGGDDVVIDAATLEQACCDAQLLGRVDVADPPKATQTIPPRVRRSVLRRHDGRCAVPGCCGSAFKELHHTERRADGGDHDPDKLVPLCTRHHAAAHRGALVVRGTYSTGFVFEHADGTPYGAPEAAPRRSATLATVLQLLVAMGWKQREARAMIDRAKPHVGHDTDVNAALKTALRHAPVMGASTVRERVAAYVKCASIDRATHVGGDAALRIARHAPMMCTSTARERIRTSVKCAAIGRAIHESVGADGYVALRIAPERAPRMSMSTTREPAPYLESAAMDRAQPHVGQGADGDAALQRSPGVSTARERAAPYVIAA